MKKTATLIAALAFFAIGGAAQADTEPKLDKGELLAKTPVEQVRPVNPDDLIIINDCEEDDTRPECQKLEK